MTTAKATLGLYCLWITGFAIALAISGCTQGTNKPVPRETTLEPQHVPLNDDSIELERWRIDGPHKWSD